MFELLLIAPYDTPCYSTFRKVDAVAPVIHWQTDELAAAATNAVAEGAAVTAQDQSTPGISLNYTQLFEKTASVSSTAQATEWHGRANEMDYQVMKRGREMKRDCEFAIVGSANAAVAGDVGTARELGSAETLMSASNIDATSASTTNVTEALVLGVHQAIYNVGGDPNWLLVTPAGSSVVANFAYIDPTATANLNGRTREMEKGNKLVNLVEIYQSPYGIMSVITDRFLAGAVGAGGDETGSSMLLLETDRWAIPTLQPMQVEDLAKTGHSEEKLVSCEISLLHESPDASGAVTLINTTA